MLMCPGIQVWHAHQWEEQFNDYRNAKSNSSMMGSATGTKQDKHANDHDRNKNSNSSEETMRMHTGIHA
jgi:hypothetical protein